MSFKINEGRGLLSDRGVGDLGGGLHAVGRVPRGEGPRKHLHPEGIWNYLN